MSVQDALTGYSSAFVCVSMQVSFQFAYLRVHAVQVQFGLTNRMYFPNVDVIRNGWQIIRSKQIMECVGGWLNAQ